MTIVNLSCDFKQTVFVNTGCCLKIVLDLIIIIFNYDRVVLPGGTYFLILMSVKQTKMKKITLVSLSAFLVPFLGFAHEGHGHTHGFTITHYFVEPEHLLLLIGVLAAGILFFRSYFKKEKKV